MRPNTDIVYLTSPVIFLVDIIPEVSSSSTSGVVGGSVVVVGAFYVMKTIEHGKTII